MDSAIPFGSALGTYPERRDSQAGALDRLAQRLTGRIRQYRYSRVFPLRTVAKLVDRQAEGLDALNDAQLQGRVGELKYRLRAKGLRQEAVAEAFALVREMAGRVLGMRPFDVQLFGASDMRLGGFEVAFLHRLSRLVKQLIGFAPLRCSTGLTHDCGPRCHQRDGSIMTGPSQ